MPIEQDKLNYTAKYLILLQNNSVQRALLFNVDHRYLSELIDDDGLVLDHLIRHGQACLPPGGLSLDTIPAAAPPGTDVRCFSL